MDIKGAGGLRYFLAIHRGGSRFGFHPGVELGLVHMVEHQGKGSGLSIVEFQQLLALVHVFRGEYSQHVLPVVDHAPIPVVVPVIGDHHRVIAAGGKAVDLGLKVGGELGVGIQYGLLEPSVVHFVREKDAQGGTQDQYDYCYGQDYQ